MLGASRLQMEMAEQYGAESEKPKRQGVSLRFGDRSCFKASKRDSSIRRIKPYQTASLAYSR